MNLFVVRIDKIVNNICGFEMTVDLTTSQLLGKNTGHIMVPVDTIIDR